MEIVRFAIGLVISLGPTPEVELKLDAALLVRAEVPSALFTWAPAFHGLEHGMFNFAVPHLVVIHSDIEDKSLFNYILNHELIHIRQYAALGPALPLAYALTAGEPFEDYLGDEYMWEPPRSMMWNCPLIRINRDGVRLLPCWTFYVSPAETTAFQLYDPLF